MHTKSIEFIILSHSFQCISRFLCWFYTFFFSSASWWTPHDVLCYYWATLEAFGRWRSRINDFVFIWKKKKRKNAVYKKIWFYFFQHRQFIHVWWREDVIRNTKMIESNVLTAKKKKKGMQHTNTLKWKLPDGTRADYY